MKFLFLLTLAVLIAVTFYADYRWKRWIRENRQARSHEPGPPPTPDDGRSGMP